MKIACTLIVCAVTLCWSLFGAARAFGQQEIDAPIPKFEPHRASPRGKLDDGGSAESAQPARPMRSALQKTPRRTALDSDNPDSPGADDGTTRPSRKRTPAREPLIDELAPVSEGGQKLRPPEIMAEALANPRATGLTGQPTTLLAVLKRVADRQQQIKVTQTYWKLSAVQADDYFAQDQLERLRKITEGQDSHALVSSALASAEAAARDAQLAVVRVQHELAEQMNLPAGEGLPLATDRPHVGDYRTYYETLFSGRTPPARLRLINLTLPIRRKAIDEHGAAVVAAVHALEATGEDYLRRSAGTETMLGSFDQLADERRAFVATVRDYNQDIAEYALGVAPAGLPETTLVSMLIKAPKSASRAGSEKSNTAGPLSRGRADERAGPLEDRTNPGAERTFDNTAPDDAAPAEEPARTEESDSTNSTDSADPSGDSSEAERPASRDLYFPPRRTTRNYPAGDETTGPDTALYQGLIDLNPALRTQKLATVLHWDHGLPADAGEPASLAKVLGRAASDRRGLIAAYWQTREAMAGYRVATDRAEQLNVLAPLALELREGTEGPAIMLRVYAARAAAAAGKDDAHVRLLEAAHELTRLAQGRLDAPLLLPSTPPHAGSYRVKAGLEDRSSRVPYLASQVTQLHDQLQDRSQAVVMADAARATAVSHGAGRGALPELQAALASVRRQAATTSAFLQNVTEYNIAIADYALATLPRGATDDKLLGMLVTTTGQR